MASRKEYEMLFRLNAQLGGSYSSTFKSAQREIVAMQKGIDSLSKTQSDISAYQKQQSAVEATRQKLSVLQQQYDNIQKEISETGKFSADLQNKLLAKQLQIDKTTSSLDGATQKLNQMGAALKEAGVDTSDLGKKSADLGSQIDDLKKKQEDAADGADSFGDQASQAFLAVHQVLVAAGIAKALQEIYKYFQECVDASMDFETAMAAVRRTVGGSDKELAAIGQEFKEMSLDIPITTTELGKIAETAGQLGIAREDVTGFTEVMAELATTTDLSADNAATMLAQFANITGLTDYERLGSTVAELGDATATTASKVVDMSQGMAAAASIAGFSETDIMAVAASVGSLGIEAQAGSTAMSTLISTLYKAVETGSESLTDFASVAGMSASEFAAAWREDAVGAMDAFVQGLNDTERNGKSAIVILDELGITNVRQTKAVLGLANAGDLLSNTITQANQAWDENTALEAKASVMYGTTQSQLVMLQNAYNNMQVAIGDNYTPALQELYAIGTKLLVEVTDFIQKHPELVKAVTVFLGIICAVTGALAIYTLVVKAATAFTDAFGTVSSVALGPIMLVVVAVAALTAGMVALTGAMKYQVDESWELTAASREQYNQLQDLNAEYEQACDTYGDTSYEAQSLKWQIDDLTEEYENSKQTLEEYTAANKELIDSYLKMVASHEDTQSVLETESGTADALIAKLEELTATSDGAAKNQQAILAIINALNDAVPELSLSYDDMVNGTEGFIDSLRSIAEAQAAQKKLDAQWSEYVDRVGKQDALKSAKESAEYNAQLAQEEYDLAKKAYDDAMDLYKYDTTGMGMYWGTREEAAEMEAAKSQLDAYNAALDKTAAAYQENEQALSTLEGDLRAYNETQDDAVTTVAQMQTAMSDVQKRAEDLAASYTNMYDAALESISGQFDLWEKVKEPVATSAGAINSALESQITYWQDYNANLQKLTDRGAEIQGLSDMIASFADGSKDSVSAIAGMAGASDSDLAAMVENWQKLQEEQDNTAGSMAELETNFSKSMAALQKEVEDTVAAMNLDDAAAESGKNTVQGFINSAVDMLPQVEAAYSRVAQAAMAAIDKKLEIHSPSRVMMEKAEMTWAGYIKQTEAMKPELEAAMSASAGAAAAAFSPEDAQLVAFTPQLMAALSAYGAASAVPATPSSMGGGSSGAGAPLEIHIHFHLDGPVSEATAEALDKSGEAIAERVLDILEDRGIDAARRAYK